MHPAATRRLLCVLLGEPRQARPVTEDEADRAQLRCERAESNALAISLSREGDWDFAPLADHNRAQSREPIRCSLDDLEQATDGDVLRPCEFAVSGARTSALAKPILADEADRAKARMRST